MALTKVTSALTSLNDGITIDNITIDGTEIDLSSGSLTVDAAQNIILDHDTGHSLVLKGSGTSYASFFINNSTNLAIATGISNGEIEFFANGSERMRIDSNGLIGIGTTTPTSNGGANAGLIHLHGGSADWSVLHCTTPTTGSGAANGALLGVITDDIYVWNYNSGTIKFATAGSERMTISSSGNVGIGTTSPGYVLDVNGGSGTMSRIQSGGSSTYLAIKNTSNTGFIGIDGTNMAFYPTSTKRGNLDSSGNFVVSGSVTEYGTPSDIKLKENIEVIDNAVDKVKQLKGITYTLKSDGNRLTGLIAQDLEKVLPEAVYTAKNLEDEEHLAIRYGNTVGLLVEAIKELEARVKELEGK